MPHFATDSIKNFAQTVGIEPTRPELETGTLPIELYLCVVDLPGFEPRQTESKSVVLPLHHKSIRTFFNTVQI